MVDDYMSVKEAAAELRVHPITIRRLMRDGKIEFTEIKAFKRNRFRIPRTEIERLKRGE
jgi:excisionase family DNA binding protein